MLRLRAGPGLVVVEWPGRKAAALELICRSAKEAGQLVRDFGGRIEKLPADWLTLYTRAQKRPPLRIGRRLIITNGGGTLAPRLSPRRTAAHLVIPAGAAFGTGEHATTAMSLRLLERITRRLKGDWLFADLGTGSGILALAARSFGATRAVGVDHDATAISTARANARFNRITRTEFKIADVRCWRPERKMNVVGANLYSELLIETLPQVRRYLAPGGWLIASGIMRTQEAGVMGALRSHGIQIQEIRRRGKWIALAGIRQAGRASPKRSAS